MVVVTDEGLRGGARHPVPCGTLLTPHLPPPPPPQRVDEFIVFEPLTHPQIRDIVGLKTAALVARLGAQKVTMVLGDSALDYLADKVGLMWVGGWWGACAILDRSPTTLNTLNAKPEPTKPTNQPPPYNPPPPPQGFDPVYGARPVKRALQRELQTRLAQSLLRGDFKEGDTVRVEAAADAADGLVLVRDGGDGGGVAAATAGSAGGGEAAGDAAAGDKAAAAAGKPAAVKQRRVVVSRKLSSGVAKDKEKDQLQAVE
jgi:ATP-dependent Clp protease ATP-binding subunit ClpB